MNQRTNPGHMTCMRSTKMNSNRNKPQPRQLFQYPGLQKSKARPPRRLPPPTDPSPSQHFSETSMFRYHSQAWLRRRLLPMSLRSTTLCFHSIGLHCEEISLCAFPFQTRHHGTSFPAPTGHSFSFHELCVLINNTAVVGVGEEVFMEAVDRAYMVVAAILRVLL